jgi:serine/threonine-protein kinase
MVMDLAEGRSLASILAEQGHLKVARALDLVHQACVGLRVAHEQRIVHRDLKPENLYVCPLDDDTELLKILDFGIAKHLGATNSGPTTETGANLGTAHYMSPEQAQGVRHAIDHRTDIYSLGVILYELLSGTRPYQGESYNEILIRIVTQRPVPLNALCPNLPGEPIQIVDRAMQRDPSERFQSAGEFAVALARLLSSDVGSMCRGPSLRPATHPRSPDLGTLEVCGATGDCAEVLGAVPSRDAKAFAEARATQQSPGSLARLKVQFLLALVAVAAVTASVFWLRETSRDRRAPEAAGHPVPTVLTANFDAPQTASKTGPSARLAPVIAPNESQAFSDPPADTTRIEKQKTFSRANTVPTSAWQPKPVPPKLSGTKAVRKGPAIDEPLPPNPHAPGVSPVMK